MGIGARDRIDLLLVKKYSQEKVDNHDTSTPMVDPEKMLEAMNDYATMSRNMSALNQRLTQTCAALNARNAQYRKAVTLREYSAANC